MQNMKVINKFPNQYSLKNIPLPTLKEYQRALNTKTEKFLIRCRWKLWHYRNPNFRGNGINTFGFKSMKYPPTDKDLKDFENDLLDVVSKLEMKPFRNQMQQKMAEDIKKIRNSSSVIISADKTGNMYQLEPEEYKKFMKETITKEYSKAAPKEVEEINAEAANLAEQLELDDRVQAMAMSTGFITIKDHKPSFPNRPSFRLINPCKSEMGRISKQLLEVINSKTRAAMKVNQWRSTREVLDWFTMLDKKEECSFVQFDIDTFYPSISLELLRKAIANAEKYVLVTEEEKKIIIHCRRAVLIDTDKQVWKKKANPDFDVTMGAFDGGEVCELVGLLALDLIRAIMDSSNYGIYRDDGLAIVRGRGQEADKIRKKLHIIFNEMGLKITAEANLKEVKFLDVSLNLLDGSYKPFTKPNCQVKYVSSLSNHPPIIKKNIPASINKRLNEISSSRKSFEEEMEIYQKAIYDAGYSHKLEYNEDKDVGGPRKRQRRKNILWYNPPFSANIKTNIGKAFFSILDKHFPKDSELAKLFNRSTVKLSYSCMPSMKQVITGHNKRILTNTGREEVGGCNCRGGVGKCPLGGRCLTQTLVYRAVVSSLEGQKEYLGQTACTFKTRFTNHKASFQHQKKETSTTLSMYVWDLKRRGVEYDIKWTEAALARPYKRETKTCQLCTTEKLMISNQDPAIGLNKRREVMSRCRHVEAHLLNNWTSHHHPPLAVCGQAEEHHLGNQQPLAVCGDDCQVGQEEGVGGALPDKGGSRAQDRQGEVGDVAPPDQVGGELQDGQAEEGGVAVPDKGGGDEYEDLGAVSLHGLDHPGGGRPMTRSQTKRLNPKIV